MEKAEGRCPTGPSSIATMPFLWHCFFMERKPDEIRVALAEAKRVFSSTMLSNDTIFRLVKERLKTGRLHGIDLEDFGCEPVLAQQQDGTAKAGIRIECSRTLEVSILRSTLAVYDYVDIAIINFQEGAADPVKELMDELKTFQEESLSDKDRLKKANEAAAEVFNLWQDEWNKLKRQFREVATIDPMSSTIELKSDVENRFYSTEE